MSWKISIPELDPHFVSEALSTIKSYPSSLNSYTAATVSQICLGAPNSSSFLLPTKSALHSDDKPRFSFIDAPWPSRQWIGILSAVRPVIHSNTKLWLKSRGCRIIRRLRSLDTTCDYLHQFIILPTYAHVTGHLAGAESDREGRYIARPCSCNWAIPLSADWPADNLPAPKSISSLRWLRKASPQCCRGQTDEVTQII